MLHICTNTKLLETLFTKTAVEKNENVIHNSFGYK